MAQLDALRLVDEIRTRAVNLAISENYIRDVEIATRAGAIWAGPGSDGGLVSDLWIERAFPSKQSRDSLGSLAQRKACSHRTWPTTSTSTRSLLPIGYSSSIRRNLFALLRPQTQTVNLRSSLRLVRAQVKPRPFFFQFSPDSGATRVMSMRPG